jgi:hypothetical protein
MNQTRFFGIASVLVAFLTIHTSVNASNVGDPKVEGCTDNTKVIASNSIRIKEYNVVLVVQMRLSPKCKTRWTRAYIPAGTELYLKDKSGNKIIEYTAKVNGWNYSDMDDRIDPLQACVKHSLKKEELCTIFK